MGGSRGADLNGRLLEHDGVVPAGPSDITITKEAPFTAETFWPHLCLGQCLHFLRMKSDGENEDDGFECQTYSPGLWSEEQFGERERGQRSAQKGKVSLQ